MLAAWRPEFCRGRCTNMSARCFLLYKAPSLVAALTSLRAVEQCSENRLLNLLGRGFSRGRPQKSSFPSHPGQKGDKGVVIGTFSLSNCTLLHHRRPAVLPCRTALPVLRAQILSRGYWEHIVDIRSLSPHRVCTMNKGRQCVD